MKQEKTEQLVNHIRNQVIHCKEAGRNVAVTATARDHGAMAIMRNAHHWNIEVKCLGYARHEVRILGVLVNIGTKTEVIAL